ncbi:MAG TPA: hypothetical protein VF403_09760 [Kofleriaceae bacterium]
MRSYLILVFALGCGSGNNSTADASVTADTAVAMDASDLVPVTFAYTPAWSGATSVDVIGGFNQSTDWTSPLLTLTAAGSSFTGTAMLPPGSYPYLFHVVGDSDAGGGSATFDRYSIDGTITDFVQCPDGPTAGNDPNPCSVMTVPQVAAPTPFHITGSVVKSGTAVAKLIVLVEREEATSHHFFVNRITTTASGAYDFTVAPGQYRIQVQHPQYLSKKDSQLDPDTLGLVRRDISTSFAVAADVTVPAAEVAFAGYATFAPRTTGALPTTFTFPSGTATKLDVYGFGNEIGDPWFASTAISTGTTSFDGAFNTPKATQPNVDSTHTFMWGVEMMGPSVSGVRWTTQSLVFPIMWPTAP